MKKLLLLLGFVSSLGYAQDLRHRLYNEKVYVSTDKDVYCEGDTVRLRCFVVDSWFHSSDSVSRFCYVELLDDTDNVLIRRKIRRDNGIFTTVIPLDSTVTAGNRYLRAYTQPMKYLDPNYLPIKPIVVDNGTRAPNPIAFDGEVLSQSNAYTIDFFIEGGNRVDGAAQRVVFRSVDQNGLPVHVSGKITTTANNEGFAVESLSNGYGEFAITSKKGESYFFTDDRTSKQTPITFLEGDPAVKVVFLNDELRYQVDGVTRSYMLRIHAHGNPIAEVEINPSRTVGKLLRDNTDYGLLCFDLYDGERLVSQRLCYVPGREKSSKFQTDSDRYAAGAAIRLSADGISAGSYQVKIIRSDRLLNPIQRSNIRTELTLLADLRQSIVNPDRLLRENNTPMAIDRILIAEKWERYPADLSEYDYHCGKESGESVLGKVAGNRTAELSLYGKSLDEAFLLKPDEAGNFFTPIPDFVGSCDFFIQPISKKNKAILASDIQIREEYFPEVVNRTKAVSMAELKLDSVKTMRETPEKETYTASPIPRFVETEKGVLTLSVKEVEVYGNRPPRNPSEETKVFYSANRLSEKEVLKYSNFNIVGAVDRLMNVQVIKVNPKPNSTEIMSRYEIYSGRGPVMAGTLNKIDETTGKEYSEEHLCPMRVYVDGMLTSPDVALNMAPAEIESIERLSPAEAIPIAGAKAFCGIISIKRKTNSNSPFEGDGVNNSSKGLSFEKLGYTPNLINPETESFRAVADFSSPCTITAPRESGSYSLIVEGVTKEGKVVCDAIRIGIE